MEEMSSNRWQQSFPTKYSCLLRYGNTGAGLRRGSLSQELERQLSVVKCVGLCAARSTLLSCLGKFP